MSATRQDIERWLTEAIGNGSTHLIVACDRFDYGNYPVYVSPEQDVRKVVAETRAQEMAGVDEVYNLALPLGDQLSERRAWHV